MKKESTHSLTFYLIAVIAVTALAIFARCADAQEDGPKPKLTFKDDNQECCQYEKGESGMIISVREPLTNEKSGFGNSVTEDGFKKFSANANDAAKKLLRKLWDTPGVSNVRFSTYSVIIFKATLFSWEELEPPIVSIFEEWYATTKK